MLSWLTLTSLGTDKRATGYRLWSALIITFLYILILTTILVICNVDPNIGVIWLSTASYNWNYWAELKLVEDLLYLNLVIGSTIAIGLSALVFDVFLAWCKFHDWRTHNFGPLKPTFNKWFVDQQTKEAGFWDGAVLLEGLK